MAELVSEIQFTGSLGNLSAYRMKGTDKIILRRKGGATKKAIASRKEFELTRLNNAEFSRRAKGCAIVLRALQPLRHLADYRIAGSMNKLLKMIQVLDTTSNLGMRDIFLSRQPSMLEGFSFNRVSPFDGVLIAPVTVVIQNATVDVYVPPILPGLNFRPLNQYPFYQLIFTAGCIPDFVWSTNEYKDAANSMTTVDHFTPWLPVRAQLSEQKIQLVLPKIPMSPDCTIVVGIGIQYGIVSANGSVERVKDGSAKILASRAPQ
jgi:hypothetical protein